MAPAAALIVVAFFGGYALFGANGALAYGDYSKRLEQRKVELARVELDRARLAHRVKLLDPRHADPDLVDELVRKDMGVVGKDEIVIRLK
ncbi:MAG: septum formation initiator family protein [Sphingomonadales bacterium]